jgi:parvulin-like peptidyl-prolyl isomerase
MTRFTMAALVLAASGCASSSAAPTTSPTSVAAPAAPPAPAPAPTPGPRPSENRGQQLVKVRASHVLIAYQGARRASATRSKDEAKKLADQLLVRLRSGAKFEDVAEKSSDDPSAKGRGGDLGAFDRYTMTKAFGDAAFALDVGRISEVVETEFGFHIIKRTE